jgi:5-methyltetrahydropteroyltriglutamate--homocysteine methyltransferase
MKTARTKTLPHFFSQVIGSLPRPAMVRDLLAKRDRITTDRFKKVMDEMVVFAIRLQEQAGVDVISDGEWRRVHYIKELLNRVGGFKPVREFEHQGEVKHTDVVVTKMTAREPQFADDAAFLVKNTTGCTKFALPSPFLIAIRYWHADYSREAYPTMSHFMEHLTEILKAEAEALVAAGIDIIQLDDPAITYYCDRRLMSRGETHDERLRRDWNIDREIPQAVEAINHIVDGLKAETHLHCCHSVYKRKSDVSGNYKPILPRLKDLRIDRINLEFAYQRTGAVDDLKLLPEGMDVGMGVVDVRGERIQRVREIAEIGQAGARFISPKRIALNPDCGFAPDAGEPPTIDEAFLKLQKLVKAAERLRHTFAGKKDNI